MVMYVSLRVPWPGFSTSSVCAASVAPAAYAAKEVPWILHGRKRNTSTQWGLTTTGIESNLFSFLPQFPKTVGDLYHVSRCVGDYIVQSDSVDLSRSLKILL